MLFLRWSPMSWHFASGVPLVAGAIAAVSTVHLSHPGRRFGAAAMALGLGASLLLAGSCLTRRLRTEGHDGMDWHVVAYDAALWIRANAPETAVFAMKDAGTVGYFSGRSVVNLDGVVNNRELQRALRDQDLAGYLRRKKVGYLIQHAFLRDDPHLDWRVDGDIVTGQYGAVSVRYLSQAYLRSSDPLTLKREREVYRSPAYASEGAPTCLVIWKLDPT